MTLIHNIGNAMIDS